MAPLESRTMLAAAPFVTTTISDNRGEVIFTLSRALQATTVNSRSVQMHTAGVDGLFGTADDVKVSGRVRWFESNRRIVFKTSFLPANTTYSMKLSAKLILGTKDGAKLDGEFNGAGQRSGNGTGGGDYLFISKRDKGTTPQARFSTVAGGLNVNLFKTVSPKTVDNFFHYANEAAWDGTFFHRTVPTFVIQGGGFAVTADNAIVNVHNEAPVINEPVASNIRGTIAMAKVGGDPNSATNQWFFNLGDNSSNLDNQNGGFTVFGAVSGGATGLAVMDGIAAFPTGNASSINGAFDELPVVNASKINSSGVITSLDPQADVVSIRRVAILNNIVAFA
jgi:cyclophilin family peptidyl-prolyl cis-trans isomerase